MPKRSLRCWRGRGRAFRRRDTATQETELPPKAPRDELSREELLALVKDLLPKR